MRAALETGASLVLDFGCVEFVSSAALRVVLLAAKETRAKGGGFAIYGLREAVRRVFDISGFARVITMAGSEADAVAAAAP